MSEPSEVTIDAEAIEVPGPARRPFPTFWKAVVLSLSTLVLSIVGSLIIVIPLFVAARLLGWFSIYNPPVEVMLALMAAANTFAFGVTLVIAILWAREPLRRLFPFRGVNPALFVPVTFIVLGLHVLLYEVARLYPLPDLAESIFARLEQAPWWLAALPLVIVAPVTEELLFRGVVLSGFLRNYRTATAVVLSSLLFAAIHVNPAQLVGAFALGITMAWFFVRTRSLWLCLYGHAFGNGLEVLLLYVALPLPKWSEAREPFEVLWLDAAAVVLLVVGVAWFAWGAREKWEVRSEK